MSDLQYQCQDKFLWTLAEQRLEVLPTKKVRYAQRASQYLPEWWRLGWCSCLLFIRGRAARWSKR